MNGIVFDIQYYAVYDGPGIRTCVFLKGCPLRCAWCHNPESQSAKPEMSYFAERCAGCGACVEACPRLALRLTEAGVARDRNSCAVCGKCAAACPNGAMETIGKELAPAEIAETVARDRAFYEGSGGGVTVSGGEPTFQAEFLLEILQAIRNERIHTALETCGYFREGLIARLEELVDLFLFDIKHIDPEIHRQYTGVSNEGILANFSQVLSRVGSERIVPRIPIIPGFNDNRESIDAILTFLTRAGHTGQVHLMPYNRMAKTKWEKIGRASSYSDMGELADDTLDEIMGRIETASFEVVCNS